MHDVQELFSGRPSPTGGLLAGCDVRTRWIVGLAAVVAVVVSRRAGLGLLAFVVALGVLVVARMPLPAIARRFTGPLVLAMLVCVSQALLTGHTPLVTCDVGPWQLTATAEGFSRGMLIACRILGAFAVVTACCHGIPAAEWFAAFAWAKLPRTWIEIAVLMFRYLHVFEQRAACVVAAQKTRLGYSGLRQSFQSLGNLAGSVMLSSLDQAERSHDALVARGYQGVFPLPTLPPLHWRQRLLAFTGVVVVAAVFFLAERGWWW